MFANTIRPDDALDNVGSGDITAAEIALMGSILDNNNDALAWAEGNILVNRNWAFITGSDITFAIAPV